VFTQSTTYDERVVYTFGNTAAQTFLVPTFSDSQSDTTETLFACGAYTQSVSVTQNYVTMDEIPSFVQFS
jgi:hypothetical protein